MNTCDYCGRTNPEDALHCRECGSALPSATDQASENLGTQYSVEEAIRLRRSFEPIAIRYRWHKRVAYIATGLGVAVLLLGGVHHAGKPFPWIILPWCLFILV